MRETRCLLLLRKIETTLLYIIVATEDTTILHDFGVANTPSIEQAAQGTVEELQKNSSRHHCYDNSELRHTGDVRRPFSNLP